MDDSDEKEIYQLWFICAHLCIYCRDVNVTFSSEESENVIVHSIEELRPYNYVTCTAMPFSKILHEKVIKTSPRGINYTPSPWHARFEAAINSAISKYGKK